MRPRDARCWLAPVLVAALFSSVQAQAGSRPGWVDQPPRDSRYFHGVSSGSERQSAKDNALRDLASFIKVTVIGETKNVYRERGEMVAEDYESSVETMVEATLSGVEYETWQESEGTWWARAFLSKAKYWEPRTKARKVAVAYFKRGQEARAAGHAAEALKLLLQAQAALGQYWALPFEITVGGRKVIFLVATEDELRALARDLRLEGDRERVDAKVGKPVKAPLIVTVLHRDKPVKGLPLHFHFPACKGKLQGRVQTGRDGQAKSRVHNFLGGARRCEIHARPDVHTLLGGIEGVDEAVTKRLARTLDRIGLPKVVFLLSTEKIRAAVKIFDVHAETGKALGESYLGSAVTEALRKGGFVVKRRGPRLKRGDVEDLLDGDDSVLDKLTKAKLDLLVIGMVEVKLNAPLKGGDVYGIGDTGITIARGRATLHAIELKSGDVFTKLDESKIRGRAFTDDKALEAAREAAGKHAEEFVKRVLEHLKL